MSKLRIIEQASDAAIAEWIATRLDAALAVASHIAIAVPGGSTPFPILRDLLRRKLNWPRIEVWPGDERIVAEDHPASNVGRIRALLEPVGARIVPLEETADPPHFALVWLGMGGDGHIASLFPSSDPQADDPRRVRRLVPDPLPHDAPYERLSLTIPALLDSDEAMLVIRGADKRAVLEAADAGNSDLPIARLLRAARRPVTCFA